MNQIKFNRSLVSLITGIVLLAAPVLRADTIIVEQLRWDTGFELGNGAAQSFTVTTAGTLTTATSWEMDKPHLWTQLFL